MEVTHALVHLFLIDEDLLHRGSLPSSGGEFSPHLIALSLA
jgi:hypothetical protein